jgi:hypothetical protein
MPSVMRRAIHLACPVQPNWAGSSTRRGISCFLFFSLSYQAIAAGVPDAAKFRGRGLLRLLQPGKQPDAGSPIAVGHGGHYKALIYRINIRNDNDVTLC